MRRKVKIIVLIIILVLLGVGIGVKVHMDKTNSNLEKQRTAAIALKKTQPGIEVIKFMESGSYSGAGIWSVGTNIIIDGKSYEEILMKDGISGGEPLPGPNKNEPTETEIRVIYSNKKEEILK
ncbi:hypothetical protein [Latilactobacillus sakei]|uniref:hypothetical protein n=1 Tax=Latilactobacillus sakei TaxID=1599 RepID=UPI003F53C79A